MRFPNSPRFELEDSRKGLLEIPFPYNLMDFTTFPLCSKTILVFVIYPSRIYANSPGNIVNFDLSILEKNIVV